MCARHDFGSRGGGRVDENHHRHGLHDGGQLRECLDGVARTVVGFDRLERVVGLRRSPLGRDDVRVVRQEGCGNADGRLQETARVVAQVENESFEVARFFKLDESGGQLFGRTLLELCDADVAEVVGELLHFHGLGFDHGTFEVERDGLHFTFASDLETDLRLRFAAHQLDGIREGQFGRRFAVDTGDDVARANAGTRCGRIVDRGNDAHAGRVFGDLDAEAAEGALRCFVHVLESFDVEVARMRVETAHHAFDGRLQQLTVFDFVDVVVLDGVEDARELADFLQGKRRAVFLGVGLNADARESAREHAGADKRNGAKFVHGGGTPQ